MPPAPPPGSFGSSGDKAASAPGASAPPRRRIQGHGFHHVLARARVEGRHDGLAATRGEARQNSRRRRRKDADTGPHTKLGPPGDLLGDLHPHLPFRIAVSEPAGWVTVELMPFRFMKLL
jgi:hypothetical protein